MLTGINFSPPLYFLFNFCLQLVLPTSIEQLRLQSLIFIIIGIVLSFFLTRKIFGNTVAFLSTILVASQSDLLISQAQEARHYAMFFACGACVLYTQSLKDDTVKKHKSLIFLAHFCLCHTHYLGIIFSGLAGLSNLISNKEKPITKRIPLPVLAVWIFSLPSYLLLLSKQSSHLGNWPKPNELSDLLASYNSSLLFITIIIPTLALIILNKSNRHTETSKIKEICCSRPVMITSFLWIFVPFLVWIISNLTPLNLFVARYFIPKEASVVFLVGFILSFIIRKLHQQTSKSITMFITLALSVIIVLISSKRASFGLKKDTNYHHSLIIEETYHASEKPIILEGDHIFFPNAYLTNDEYILLVDDTKLHMRYKSFSNKLKIK